MFKGDATWAMLGTYFVFITPQYAYYILPLAVLLAALVTIGVLTKNNELVVMKACGISLYRVAVPMLVCAAAAGALLFALEETVLGPANRRAERLRSIIRSGVATTEVDRRASGWPATRGEIYNYTYADPATQGAAAGQLFSLNEDRSRLEARTFAERAPCRAQPAPTHWTLEQRLDARLPRTTAPPRSSPRSRPGRRRMAPAVRVRHRRARRALHGLPAAAATTPSASAPAGSTCSAWRWRWRASCRSPS